MNRMLESRTLRAVAVALLAFFSTVLAGAASGSAYTLDFTGKVTEVGNHSIFQALGIVPTDRVSGTVTINPLNTVPDFAGSSGAQFSQVSFAYTFKVSHPGAVGGGIEVSKISDGLISTALVPNDFTGLRFASQGGNAELLLTYQTDPSGGPLLSLAGLPSTSAGLIAFLGGSSPEAFGVFGLATFGLLRFSIDTAVTPIPAALPLFASALGGLGFLSWRRRGAQRAASTSV